MHRPVEEKPASETPAQRQAGAAPVTRFAPSPTGYMHLGHAYSAFVGWRAAREAGGRFHLRIEDIDGGRCRPTFEQAIYDDLAWLGIDWDGPVRRQSEHTADYAAALEELSRLGAIYPCFCIDAEVRAEIKRAGAAPHGTDGAHYPGTCRGLGRQEQNRRIRAGRAHALRIDAAKAAALAGPLTWTDRKAGTVKADVLAGGDVILARRDVPTSYHLAVTLDDHIQEVTLATRGWDLFEATHLHRVLQALLGLRTPVYYHHPMINDSSGVRLAKRNRAVTLRGLRNARKSPEDIRRMIGLE